ncbi:murein L,D-transpeptidase catalytic domain family protein [Oceanivirga salmonicida]|uniref:murein L,D-transpeptidase catalytic domain family protein n=1 Tax=Oceanivirga salmonicida TaxID=1769291 RepID=UPI00082EB070|nr:murein L,D-transpeptidase catalytic domain family protein [Oceanivirga salmonicida]
MYIKKFLVLIFSMISIFSYSLSGLNIENISNKYKDLKLEKKVAFSAFQKAIEGYNKISKKINNIITIVDFTKPSTEKRMYVIDLEKNEVLISSYVSHGKRTGGLYAKQFSNKVGSSKSSPGLFLTGNIYKGINGASLELYGLEKGVNSNARKRSIVIHGAEYAESDFIHKNGALGRSRGCFAVPFSINKKLINTIVGGSVFYVHTTRSK